MHRPSLRGSVAPISAVALAAGLALIGTPASAGTVNFQTSCQATPSTSLAGPQHKVVAASAIVTAPATVNAGQTFTYRIQPGPGSYPDSESGGTTAGLSRLKFDFEIPANTTFVDATVVAGTGGNLAGVAPNVLRIGTSGNVDAAGPLLRLSGNNQVIGNSPTSSGNSEGGITAPKLKKNLDGTANSGGNSIFQLPAVDVTVVAGSAGTITPKLRVAGNAASYNSDENYSTSLAKASAPFVGTVWAPTRCSPRDSSSGALNAGGGALATIAVSTPEVSTTTAVTVPATATAGAPVTLSATVSPAPNGGTVQFLNPAFGIWFTEVFLFLGLGWVMLRFTGWRPPVYTGLTPAPRAATVFGFLLGVANFFALVVPIQYVAQSLAPEWLTKMFDGSRLFEGQTSIELALILTGVSVAAPVCEEFFFRGILQKGLTPVPPASPVRALVVSAVVFSAFHLDPVGFAARAELGLLFGWLYLRTGSLWPGIGAHAANNIVSSVLFLAAKALGQEASDAETDPRAVLALAGLGAIGLFGLLSAARRYPVLWGDTARASEEDAYEPQPLPSLARLLLPWVVGATLALGALGAVDARGISLNFYDAQHSLPELEKDAAPGLHAERKALQVLRSAARRGELPMEGYYEERERQIRAHREALGLPKRP